MFTGIVESTGTVVAAYTGATRDGVPAPAEAGPATGAASTGEVGPGFQARRLVVETPLDLSALTVGASIAVDGVCLTVVELGPGKFGADLGPETLARTTLGTLGPGDRVHLERALRAGDALGGHLVTGHVDAVGQIVANRDLGEAREIVMSVPAELAPALVPKGSIAVDGISLTVNTVDGPRFSVTLIPHTLEVTRLGAKPVGAPVNIEIDVIAKQVERLVRIYLEAREGAAGVAATSQLTSEVLKRNGFAP